MQVFSSRLASFVIGLLMMCGVAAPAHAQVVSQGQVIAAQQYAINVARAATIYAGLVTRYRAEAATWAARAQQATNAAVRRAYQARSDAFTALANAYQSAFNYWNGIANQAQATYRALLARFQATTCLRLPRLPLCSVSPN